MKRRDDEWESWDDDIASFLAEYHVAYPSQHAIDETVDVVLMHMSRRTNVITKAVDTFRKLLRTTAFEAHYVHPGYWALIVLLYVAGLVAVGIDLASPYVTAFYLAPTPLLFGLFILFRNCEQGVAELEAACKHSAHQVMFAKFLLVAAVNVIADLVLIMGIHTFASTTALTNLLTLCLWPSLLLSAVSFVVSANTRSTYVIASVMALWTALSAFCTQAPEVMQFFVATSLVMCLPAAGVFLLAFVWQVLRMKRGITHEFVN